MYSNCDYNDVFEVSETFKRSVSSDVEKLNQENYVIYIYALKADFILHIFIKFHFVY